VWGYPLSRVFARRGLPDKGRASARVTGQRRASEIGDKVPQLEVRHCAWCHGPISQAARSDALTCSKACRQARSRFRVGSAGPASGLPMRYAYADPPYPGMAHKYYGTSEVNHEILIGTLVRDYPDGWALSTAASTLQEVLVLCPAGVRVCAWIKGPRHGESWRPRSAWEPLIVFRGRPRRLDVGEYSCDTLLWGGRQHSHPGALIGMKPAAFAEWMFQQLGALAGDSLVDLFPGSGSIGRAWDMYSSRPRQLSLPPASPAPRGRRDGYRRDTSCLAGAERRLGDILGRG
jgi:hypothetical protein